MVDTSPRVAQHIVMGVQIPLGPAELLLRVTAARKGAIADADAFAGLRAIELRDGVLCQMNAPCRPLLDQFMKPTMCDFQTPR